MSEVQEVVAEGRVTSRLPKIGIRPALDGRDSARQALEGQTMAMARAVAGFLSTRLRHANGSLVECVIADTCVGGLLDSALAADKFAREGVGLTITVSPTWCYASEVMDMNPLLPKAVWGFNGSDWPGAVYLASALSAHAQKGLPAFGIYGQDVQDAGDLAIPVDVGEKLLRFARAGLAVAALRGKTYLSLGGVCMGMAGSIVDHDFFESYLDMRVKTVDMSELGRRMESRVYDLDEFERARRWVRQNCQEGPDPNPPAARRDRAQQDRDWDDVVRMAMIVRDMMVGNQRLARMGHNEEAQGNHAILAGFQGQRHWTDHRPNGDFLETMLNTSFDWDGPREPYVVTTENDSLNGVAMLFGHLLTAAASVFADVRTYWSPAAVRRIMGCELRGRAEGGFIHLINSGSASLDATGQALIDGKPAMKPFWSITAEDIQRCLAATTWYPALTSNFLGGGFSAHFLTPGNMPVTLSRVNLVKGAGPVLQVVEGYTVDLPDEVFSAIDRRTSPTWPTHWFVPNLTGREPFTDVYSVMAAWGANHGALSYGHVGADLITLASILRMPVSLHNVSSREVFRPHVWSAFGTADPEAADFRACAHFGPLY